MEVDGPEEEIMQQPPIQNNSEGKINFFSLKSDI